MDEFIERRIITGLIVSTEYIRVVLPMWNPQFLISVTARILAGWCLDYFRQYNQAPGRDIEGIYSQKLKAGLRKEQAEDIEQILAGLSEEYAHTQFNVDYLLDETHAYFKGRHLDNYTDRIRGALSTGEVTEAERLACSYLPISGDGHSSIDPFSEWEEFKEAFSEKQTPLIRFGKVLGEFWNAQFTRDAFVAFMGPEKRGKSFMLLEIAVKAYVQKCNVVLFQAGDMSQKQQLRRMGIYFARRSDEERYCGELYLPMVDCLHNQTDTCDRGERECDFGVFEQGVKLPPKYGELVTAFRENANYRPCTACPRYKTSGAVWFTRRDPVNPLTWREAYKAAMKFKERAGKRFKLSTHPNESLTILEIKTLLDIWEKQEQFVPDVIVIDYADILAPDPDIAKYDFRNQTNKMWQRLRGLSQEKHCLIVTATQTDAASYEKELIRRSNFSEDKRKIAHVTAMYGLNQTENEKKIGIMRINEIALREGEYYETNYVNVLQRLQTGRPFRGSFK